jgi:hypothetical protein
MLLLKSIALETLAAFSFGWCAWKTNGVSRGMALLFFCVSMFIVVDSLLRLIWHTRLSDLM